MHFKDILEEFYDIHISYTPLYNLLTAKGFKSVRKHRKPKVHNRRKERHNNCQSNKTVKSIIEVDYILNDQTKYPYYHTSY